ncbi:O-methyltransferase [Parashewanella tropica]|uniref:O-methyltransferase n=1 Tax=Parashewanella tropica TaxID=2547970 RepID=UPI0010599F74|nr:class I SAM-dependent methyltransferase [Parashewanella tropica]
MNALYHPTVQQTLDVLHDEAKLDWKPMLKYAPQIIWGLMKGKGLMKALTPEMAKDSYMPVSKEQGEFLYNMVRATNAKNIVEFGTSFGIGTIYLAAGAQDNDGHVYTSEIEPHKCQVANQNIAKAGFSDSVTLLEGDALETLKTVEDGIDLLFLDGWKDLYNDVLDLMLPKLRIGATVIGDNITLAEARKYFARVSAPGSGFVTTVVNKDTALSCYIGK